MRKFLLAVLLTATASSAFAVTCHNPRTGAVLTDRGFCPAGWETIW